MSYNDKFIDNFEPENMKLRKIKFPKSLRDKVFTCSSLNTDFRPVNQLKSSTKGEKPMNLVIKPDKYTIYQISKDDIQELKHISEHDVEDSFSYLLTLGSTESFTPTYHYKEKWYVVLKNGKRINLTKKQYTIIKGWFKGEK